MAARPVPKSPPRARSPEFKAETPALDRARNELVPYSATLPLLPGLPPMLPVPSNLPPILPLPGAPLPLPGMGTLPAIQSDDGSFRLPKARLGMVNDSTVDKIISGWDWFMARKPPIEIKSLEDVRDSMQLVRIGAIGDQSCFYHSTCKALVSLYQDEKQLLPWYEGEMKLRSGLRPYPHSATVRGNKLLEARQYFADKFRRDIATWLCTQAVKPDGKVYTDDEVKMFLNTRPGQIEDALTGGANVGDPTTGGIARDPFHVRFSEFSNPVIMTMYSFAKESGEYVAKAKVHSFSWAAAMVAELYNPDEIKSREALAQILTTTVNRDPEFLDARVTPLIFNLRNTIEDSFFTDDGAKAIAMLAIENARFTEESLAAALAAKAASITGERGYTGRRMAPDYKSVAELKNEFAVNTATFSKVIGPVETNPYYLYYNYEVSVGINEGKSVDEILTKIGFAIPRDVSDGKGGIRRTYDPPRTAQGDYYTLDTKPDFFKYRTFIREYIATMKMLITIFRGVFGDPATFQFRNYRKLPAVEPVAFEIQGGARLIVSSETAAQDFLNLLPHSINPITQVFFKPEEVKALALRDPRIGVIRDSRVLALPISLNYFLMDNGGNIARYNLFEETRGDERKSFKLPDIIHSILPRLQPDGHIARIDAGVTDVVTLMPHIINVNIYLVQLYGHYIHVVNKFMAPASETRPSIVIHWISGHFEVVGAIAEGGVGAPIPITNLSGIQTAFWPTHPFIQAIEEYIIRRTVAGGQGTLEKGLAVDRVPERPGGGTIFGPSAIARPILPKVRLPSLLPLPMGGLPSLRSRLPIPLSTLPPLPPIVSIQSIMDSMGVGRDEATLLYNLSRESSPPRLPPVKRSSILPPLPPLPF